MPEKEGSDEKKDAKAVVNRKQKQMMNQEQLDLSSVAESFGGQIIGEPVELDEDAGVVSLPLLTIGALTAAGIIGTDSYQKLRGKPGFLPDMSGEVKGVYDKARGVFRSKQTQTDDSTQSKRRKKIQRILKKSGDEQKKDLADLLNVNRKNINKKKTKINPNIDKNIDKNFGDALKKNREIVKNLNKNTKKPSKEDIEKLKEIPKKKKINQDQDQQQQSKPPEFDPKKQPETDNKTLKDLVKIGAAGTTGAAITNKLKKDQTQKVNQDKKISTITKTKTNKKTKGGRLPSVRFPGTAHIVGRRSNPQ